MRMYRQALDEGRVQFSNTKDGAGTMQFDELLIQLLSSDIPEGEPLDEAFLLQLVDLAERCPSVGDQQPLKYVLAWEPLQIDMISRHLRHGTVLDFAPEFDLRPEPAGFIVVMADTEISISIRYDLAGRVAAHAILLGAAMADLDGCVVHSIDRTGLRAALSLPHHLEILTIVVLRRPRHTLLRSDGTPDARPVWCHAEQVGGGPSPSELVVEVVGF